MSNKKKLRTYNWELFFMGFLLNISKNFFLWIPGLILCIIGIFSRTLLYIGLALIAAAVIISFIEQWQIKRTVETSDNPNFSPLADAMSRDSWREELMELVEKRVTEETDSGELSTENKKDVENL